MLGLTDGCHAMHRNDSRLRSHSLLQISPQYLVFLLGPVAVMDYLFEDARQSRDLSGPLSGDHQI